MKNFARRRLSTVSTHDGPTSPDSSAASNTEIDRLSVVEGVLFAAGGVLFLDWLVAPKGKSLVGQVVERVLPGHLGHHELPPPPPPMILPPVAAKGYYAGANLGAGFGHGYMPYGPWAHADPGGPTQYAHAAQRRVADLNVHGWYDWEE